jgi:hypothetical protein
MVKYRAKSKSSGMVYIPQIHNIYIYIYIYIHTHTHTHTHTYICVYLGQKVRNPHGQIQGEIEVLRNGHDTLCIGQEALTESEKLCASDTVCMYACMYACRYVCVYVRVISQEALTNCARRTPYVCMYVSMHEWMQACVYVRVISQEMLTESEKLCASDTVCMYVCMCVCAYM